MTDDMLSAVAVAIDQAAEERGWNSGHLLVKIELDGDDIEFGFKDIDGHPLDTLTDLVAPAEWLAVGVCCEGWMAPIETGKRPSQSKGRKRMRATCLVHRDGTIVSGVRVAGEDFEIKEDEATGAIVDALRSVLHGGWQPS